MNHYITGTAIKTLREKKHYTQACLQLRGMGKLYIYCNKHSLMCCRK